ncbi:Satratoxin biosynthesis SC1 cluster protein 4 [Colletotrichum shisoi]|uniref:Satratoxin biosynthesis SC1 cluster protein 4 n=1 Tax=Colletotrichum shisoi TaxID=2078593 RepID=A0A5Q4BPU3_9PEZI|nr:Satratoxin biosynthesis SC1 cluster protein 4 [Colletotrichum shisoi]
MESPQLAPEELARDRSPIALGVTSMCMVIVTSVLALRLWTRFHVVKKVGVDDYAATFSLLSVLGCGISIAVMTRYGLGRHDQTLTMDQMIKFSKCFWCSVFFYSLSHLSLKMSFLLQYYRVLCTTHMRKVYIVAMVIVGSWGTSVVVMSFVFCIPLEGFWDHRVPAKCLGQQVLFYAFGACSIATDVIIFLLPMPALFTLKIPRSQKLYLLGIFSLGFLIVAISVIRLQFLKIQPDFTWYNVEPAMWSISELTAAMVCLCLPPLKALAARLGLLATRTGNTSQRNSRNFGGPSSTAPLSPSPKTFDSSPGEKPGTFDNFVVESEQFSDGMIRPTPALAV